MNDTLKLEEFYKKMLLIRYFEEGVLKLFEEGKLFGTTHPYIGQEANAVGIITNLNSDDIVVSNHRCHGHYITHKQNPYALLCEMMGKKDGLCAGRGGSQHIYDEGFFSNGVQGGILPLAAGLAFAEKFKKSGKIVAVFIGDGTLGEGVLYEILNIASKWKLPLLIIVENNQYAQSAHFELTLAGKMIDRFKAFDIESIELTTFDVSEIYESSSNLIEKVRKHRIPKCIIINTYRFASHSKSDDGRDKNEIERWKANDPLSIIEERLDKNKIKDIRNSVEKIISSETKRAIKIPMAE